MNTERDYAIVNGPSKHVLIDCFKYSYDPVGEINLDFKIEICKGLTYLVLNNFHIITIQHEDGSGESFNLSGWCEEHGRDYEFKAYYNTRRREGVISFKKP